MRIFNAVIVSIGTNKTATAEVTRRTPHPLYRKLIKRSKKFIVDSGEFELLLGNRVKITETRPMSKNKYFKVTEVVSAREVKRVRTPKVQSPEAEVETAIESLKPVSKVAKKTKTVKKGKK